MILQVFANLFLAFPSSGASVSHLMKYIALIAVVLLFFMPVSIAKSDNDLTPVPIEEEAMIPSRSIPIAAPTPIKSAEISKKPPKLVFAFVTGYNTVPDQTDQTPCTAAGGRICGRTDTVACPPSIPLHSWVSIGGKKYECMDRTASRYKARFDVSCDKNTACPARITGWYHVKVP